MTTRPRFLVAALATALSVPCQGGPFSFPNDQAPRDVIIPAVVPVLFEAVKPGDAPLILRTTTLLNHVWFDAIAPYSDLAVGISSTIPRRPVGERTDTNRNTAIFYASLRMLESLYPQAADERAEAGYVIGEVLKIREAGASLQDIAVFYRTHAQSRPLEEELLKYNLPYVVVGGTRFYDRAEVKDALAYLRVLNNPDDTESLLRIINRPARS